MFACMFSFFVPVNETFAKLALLSEKVRETRSRFPAESEGRTCRLVGQASDCGGLQPDLQLLDICGRRTESPLPTRDFRAGVRAIDYALACERLSAPRAASRRRPDCARCYARGATVRRAMLPRFLPV